jgi:hypothetical protein
VLAFSELPSESIYQWHLVFVITDRNLQTAGLPEECGTCVDKFPISEREEGILFRRAESGSLRRSHGPAAMETVCNITGAKTSGVKKDNR